MPSDDLRHKLMLTVAAFALALLATVGTGCSGIHASQSISPLDFILPGLMQNRPPTPEPLQDSTAAIRLAQEHAEALQQRADHEHSNSSVRSVAHGGR